MSLERALQKATDDVDALVEAWKLNPHPRISAVASRLPASAVFTGLFEGKLADVAEKLGALKVRQHPHLSNELERVLREPPWSSTGSRAVWGQLFSLVSASRDPRFLALANELPPTWAMRSDQKAWLTAAFTAAVASIPAVVELTNEQSSLLHALERDAFSQAPAPRRSATVDFAAVYVSPHDDAPRLVLADALLERGDPRGEYLSLALREEKTSAEKKRESALLKTHAKSWLAPFGTSLGATVTWRRGFPAEGTVKFRDGADVKKYGALPEWATFESLTWTLPRSPEHTAAAGFIGPAFRHLRRAADVHLPHLLEGSWALTWVRGAAGSADALAALLTHPGLSRLEALHLTDPGFTAEWLARPKRWGAVQELGVATNYPALLLHVLAAADASPLTRLQWGEALRFHRERGGSLTRLELLDPRGGYRIDSQLDSLPEGTVTSLVAPPSAQWTTGPLGAALTRATRQGQKGATLAGAARRHLGLGGARSMAWAAGRVMVSDGVQVKTVDAKTLEVIGTSDRGGLLAPDGRDVLIPRQAASSRSSSPAAKSEWCSRARSSTASSGAPMALAPPSRRGRRCSSSRSRRAEWSSNVQASTPGSTRRARGCW